MMLLHSSSVRIGSPNSRNVAWMEAMMMGCVSARVPSKSNMTNCVIVRLR